MKIIINFVLIILLLVTATNAVSLEWQNQYCDVDMTCKKIVPDSICITKYTDDSVFSLSSKSDVNVITAQQLGYEGKCARIYHKIDDTNKVYYNTFVGTLTIPEKVVKTELECPVVEPEIVYLNQTRYEEVIVVETDYFWTIIVSLMFSMIIISMLLFIKSKKYVSKSKQFDRLKSFSPTFVRQNLKGKSMKEITNMIKESEGK